MSVQIIVTSETGRFVLGTDKITGVAEHPMGGTVVSFVDISGATKVVRLQEPFDFIAQMMGAISLEEYMYEPDTDDSDDESDE